jgi:methyl-accepting chemotaxis protein
MKVEFNKNFILEDIIKQTNIIAINAAIVASRIGISKDELVKLALKVRNLAEHYQKITKETRKLDVSREETDYMSFTILNEILPDILTKDKLLKKIKTNCYN